MLENLRRKSLVNSYSSRQENISFELGCATYGDLISMPQSQRFEIRPAKITTSFSRIAKQLTELLKIEYAAFGYKFNMILCPSSGKGKPKTFLLGEILVTQDLYRRLTQKNPSYFNGITYDRIIYSRDTVARDIGTDLSRPLETVSVFKMIEFCNALSLLHGFEPCYTLKGEYNWDCDFKKNGYRFPTEKEWTYAAKAGTENKWAGTNGIWQLSEYAWYKRNSNIQTQPTKAKLPNEWGFYDMSGNVWEVCAKKENPNNPNDDIYPILGGSYMSDETIIEIRSKDAISSQRSNEDIGFRLARTISK